MTWNSVLRNMSAGRRDGRRSLPAVGISRILSVSLIFCGCAALFLSGCTAGKTGGQKGSRENADGTDRISVVTTIFPQYDFVREIAGDNVDLKMLLKPGEESHSYEPTPQDIIAIQESDLFIYTGGENDVWVEDILSSMPDEDRLTLKLSDCVDTLEEEHVEGMKEAPGHEHDEDEEDAADDEVDVHDGEADVHDEEGEAHSVHEIDEHVWTSPVNAGLIVERIKELLITADPAHEKLYEENTAAYEEELAELDRQFREVTENAGSRLLIFGDRFPFRYLAEEYGLDYYAAFPGCASDTEPSAATMVFLIDKVKEEQVPAVLKMELSNPDIARAIAEATGTEVKVLYSCHNLSAEEFENGETYLSMMQKNVETLKEVLNGWH